MYNDLYRKGPIGVAALKNKASSKKKRVKIGGIEYDSITHAARKLRTAHSTITKYINDKKPFRGMDIEILS